MSMKSRARRRSLALKNFATLRVMRVVGAMVAAVEGGVGIGMLGMLRIGSKKLRVSSLRLGVVSEIGFEVGTRVGMEVGVRVVRGGTGTVGAVTGGVGAIRVWLTL